MAERFKLTLTEALALLGVVEREIGLAPVILAIQQSVPAKAGAIIGREKGIRLTADEAIALVAAILPLIPAADTKGKMLWLIRNARPCFPVPGRFDAAIEYLKSRVEAFVRGGGVDAVPSSALPALGSAPIGGYGRVNQWWKRPELLDRETSLMLKHGVRCYNIELVGNGEEDVLGSQLKTEEVKAAYIALLRHCRAKGIWLLVSAFNDNQGNGRYRNGKVKMSSRLPQALAMLQFVKEQGPANVLLQPVAETQTDAGRQIEKQAAAIMSGFILVNNGSMGRPSAPASWAQYRAWHPTSTANWPTGHIAKTILVSDTGAILAQLHKGGDIYGDGNPDAIRAWIHAGAAKGFPIIAHYAFQVEGVDEACIKACGLPVAGAVQPTPISGGAIPAGTIWLHHNVSAWPVTANLNASIDRSNVYLRYDKASVWPGRNTTAGNGLNANPWVFVTYGGKMYAATWEWLKAGQQSKARKALNGDHIKASPLNNWTPRTGERIGLMVSGLARHVERNVQERSNIVWLEIP